MTGGTSRSVIVAVLAFGLVAACAGGAKRGDPTVRASPPSPTPRPSVITLPDRRTIDPCGLVPLSTLQKFGRVTEGQSVNGLLACDVSITMADHGEAALTIRLDEPRVTQSDMTMHDLVTESESLGLSVVHPRYENTRDSQACIHQLNFADRSAIGVDAFAPSNLATDDFCLIGKAALAAVVSAVRRGHLKHRTFPANTLAARPDICGMVTPDIRGLVPSLRSATLDESPGGVRCVWKNGEFSLMWSIYATPRAGMSYEPRPYLDRAQIAGRETVLTRLIPGRCDATTSGHALGVTDVEGNADWEVAALTIFGPTDPDSLCVIGRNVAAMLWPTLPK